MSFIVSVGEIGYTQTLSAAVFAVFPVRVVIVTVLPTVTEFP